MTLLTRVRDKKVTKQTPKTKKLVDLVERHTNLVRVMKKYLKCLSALKKCVMVTQTR